VVEWYGSETTKPGDAVLASLFDILMCQRPTAIVCWNDMAAYDTLAHCRRRGVHVPDELAVVGFDGIQTPLQSVWQLTTVRAPWTQVACIAVDLLVDQMEERSVARETMVPVEFVAGDTT
jgi:LacI family transcriptional regulator